MVSPNCPARVAAGMEDIFPDRLLFSVVRLPFWEGTPQLESDIRHVPGFAMFHQAYVRHGIASAVAVPVMKFGEVRAGLMIRSAHVSFFSPRMIELLQQAAASIGLGLDAHEQRMLRLQSVREEACQQRALRLLSEMVKVVTHSPDEQTLLVDACRVARRMGGYLVSWLALRDGGDGQTLRLRAHDGLADGFQASPDLILGDAAQVDHPAVIAMLSGQSQVRHPPPPGHTEWPLAGDLPHPCAVLARPLLVEGAVVGIFVRAASDADAFAPTEVQVFSEMAIELGLGIQMQRAQAARLAAEQGLRFNLQHFRTVLSNQYSGILVMSEDHRVKFVNEAFCALCGLSEAPSELENLAAAAIYERLKETLEDPEREWQRVQDILTRNEAVKGGKVSIKGGRIFPCDFTPITIDGVSQGRLWHQCDITERKMHETRVERLAFYDVVTGLPNRRLLFQLLEKARTRAMEQRSLMAVGVLDLDRFKSVNDTIGPGGGDQVLVEASTRILGMLREEDVLARFGRDEFALVISGLDSREQLDLISRCSLQALRAPFHAMGEQLYLSASIGWTLFPRDEFDAEGLIRHVDLAMYAAKEGGCCTSR